MRLALPPLLHGAALGARRRLGESRLLWWSVVGVVALAAGALVRDVQGDAERLRSAWGETVPVVVARRDLLPGEPLDAGAVELDVLPRGVVPPGALQALPGPGTVSVAAIRAGEVVHEARAGPAAGGLGAVLPPGTVGVAVPVEAAAAAALALSPGTAVNIVTTDPLSGQPSAAAVAALVVRVEGGVAVVAVPEAEGPALAAAAGAGSATIAVRAG